MSLQTTIYSLNGKHQRSRLFYAWLTFVISGPIRFRAFAVDPRNTEKVYTYEILQFSGVLILPKLNHMVFWCNNLKRVGKFYEEILGFEVHNVNPKGKEMK